MVPTAVGYWIAAAVAWAISAWTIGAAVVHVARGRGRAWSFDVVTAVLLHGGMAILALWLAYMARSSGHG